MILYRIENELLQGPWTTGMVGELYMRQNISNPLSVPEPEEKGEPFEGQNNWSSEYKFAFKDEKTLQKYFNRIHLRLLERWGFSVNEIEIPSNLISELRFGKSGQVAFIEFREET